MRGYESNRALIHCARVCKESPWSLRGRLGEGCNFGNPEQVSEEPSERTGTLARYKAVGEARSRKKTTVSEMLRWNPMLT